MAEQKALFGEVDKVRSALETEKTFLKEEVKRAQDTIERKKKEIGILDERVEKLESAIEIVKKSQAKKKNP